MAQAVPPRGRPEILHVVLSGLGIGLTLLILIDGFTAKKPYFPPFPQFRVDSATFSPLNATGDELTATWDLTLPVQNPSNDSIAYEEFEVLLRDSRGFLISTLKLPPFSQPAKNTTSLHAHARLRAVGPGAYVEGGFLWEDRSLILRVELVAQARLTLTSRSEDLWLRCWSVRFVLSRNGTSGGPEKRCRYVL